MSAVELARALEATLRPLGEAAQLPRALYVDEALFALERRAIYARSWVPVAHVADLERPGDWVRASIAGEAIALVRGADLEVRALVDVCRHRGVRLLDGDRGACAALEVVCPYHAWAYDLSGRLLRAPGMPAPFARDRNGLLELPVVERFGQLFVRLDGLERATPSGPQRVDSGQADTALTDTVRTDTGWENTGTQNTSRVNAGRVQAASGEARLGPGRALELPPWLAALDAALLRRVRARSWVTRANWKLVVENFQESHHFLTIHPGLERLTPARRSSSTTDAAGWLGGLMDLAPGAETVSLSGRVGRRPFLVAPEERRVVRDALVMPALLTSLQPDYLLTYRLEPIALDATRVTAEVFFHAGAPFGEDDAEDVLAFWDRTNAEDRAICERQQLGLSSSLLDSSPRPGYAPSEDGVWAFDRWVARRLLDELAAETPTFGVADPAGEGRDGRDDELGGEP